MSEGKKTHLKIIVRGGGDLATGIIYSLTEAGFRVLVLESETPSAIRRQVAFSEAVYEGRTQVEERTAVRIETLQDAQAVWEQKEIPVLVDPMGNSIEAFQPDILVDAIIAKKNLGTVMTMAPLTIGVGPGFCAGVDVHAVVETKRGHKLGRIIRKGEAIPNTGIPGNIGGFTKERVIHSPEEGILHNICPIGSIVKKGETIASLSAKTGEEIPIPATLNGILRGMIRDGYAVTKGFKIADIDPRMDELKNCFTISDKSRCIAGAVLQLVCAYANGEDPK